MNPLGLIERLMTGGRAKASRLGFGLVMLGLLAVAGESRLGAAPPNGGDWQLVFADEFNGATADLDKHWEFQNGPSGHILCSRWRENAVATNGTLRLINRKEQRGGQEWTSASMSTKAQFKYGYFECRYRYGAATGLNNSFWIMTRGGNTNTPGRFEIDINEGHFPDKVNMNIHNWSGKHWAKSKSWRAKDQDLSRDFHVYALEWSERELVWFFDGREIRRETNSICHREAPVLLSSAIIKWAGEVTDRIDGTAMEVDYVRVYQRGKNKRADILKKNGKHYLFRAGNTGDGKSYPLHRNNQRIGVAVAEKPEGPWKRFGKPIVDVSSDKTTFDSLMAAKRTGEFPAMFMSRSSRYRRHDFTL